MVFQCLPEGKRAALLARVGDVYCDFITFPFGILGQVWYFIVSIPGPCCLPYFNIKYLTMYEMHMHGDVIRMLLDGFVYVREKTAC